MKVVRTACALHFLSLALWVGGLAAIAFVVAPTAFAAAPPETAGRFVGDSLRRFGRWEMILGSLAIFSAILCQFVGVWGPRVRWPRLLALVAMAALSIVYTQVIYPPMQDLRTRRAAGDAAAAAEFDRLHRMSTRVVGANLLLGIAVLGVSAATIRSPDGS